MGEIFERTAPKEPLAFTGERLTTGIDGQIQIEHLHRYFLARDLCRGLDVLDVAAGEGYGTALLAQTARSVVGVEISDEAVQHAAGAYVGPNFRYIRGDARSLPLNDASVDAVVSFETIEHFYEHDRFLAEVRRVLRPGGRFIVSSPDRDVFSPAGSSANGYHVHELSGHEFRTLLSASFRHVHMLGQRPMLGSVLVSDPGAGSRALTFEKRGPHHFEASTGMPRPVYWVAVASDQPITAIPDSVYIDNGEIAKLIEAGEVVDAVAAERAALIAQTQNAENALASMAVELAKAVEQSTIQTELFRQQMTAMDQASHDHAARASALDVEVARLNGEKAALVAQTEAAEAALAAISVELSQAVEQSTMQTESFRQQMIALDQASHDHAARSGALQIEIAELHREHADKVLALDAEMASLREAHDAELAELRSEMQMLREDAKNALAGADLARAEAAHACRQRDVARVAARRAAIVSQEWQGRYYALRGRLDTALKRSWILPASRLIPPTLRRRLRETLLGGPHR